MGGSVVRALTRVHEFVEEGSKGQGRMKQVDEDYIEKVRGVMDEVRNVEKRCLGLGCEKCGVTRSGRLQDN